MTLRTKLLIILCLFALEGWSQKNTADKPMSGNPILEGWYADPEGIIFDSLYWIYPTFSAAFGEQVYLDAFSSPDLITWQKHPHIIDTTAVTWAKQAMWAPSVVKKGKKYYLFFSANDIQTPESRWWKEGESMTYGGIGVGVSDHPGGPFQDYLGKPLIAKVYNQAQPIDPFVFQGEDKQYYIIYGGWGRCNVGRLNNDLTALVPFENGKLVKEITPEGYVEGPILFSRKGQYYFMWSEGNWTQSNYQVAYGTTSNPLGPFDRKGVVLQKDERIATGAGHHSVINPPGTDDWYIIYHRRPIPNEGRDHRVVCIDRLYFNDDGTIQPVEMTREGVARRPLVAP